MINAPADPSKSLPTPLPAGNGTAAVGIVENTAAAAPKPCWCDTVMDMDADNVASDNGEAAANVAVVLVV